MKLAITRFGSPYNTRGVLVHVNAGSFLREFDNPFIRERKDKVPLWSAATFENNDRKEGSPTLSLSAFTAEYDATIRIAEALEIWGEFYGKLYTTHSHRPETHRFRFILPYSRPVNPGEHRRICEWAYHRSPDFDVKCSRNVKCIWYLPSRKPDGVFESHDLTGGVLDVDQILPLVPAPSPLPAEPVSVTGVCQSSLALRRASALLSKIAPGVQGDHRGTQVFVAAMAMTKGFCLSESQAFDLMWPWAQLCDPPCSRAYLERKIAQAAKHGNKPSGYLLNAGAA
jgi:hypothetical protein